MNCSNQRSENDKVVVCRKAYHKNYYAKDREQILARQKRYRTENAEILKSRRKSWYENNRERLAISQRAYCQQNKEHIRNYRRQYCKNNRVRINRSSKDFVTKNKENRSEYRAFCGLGPRVWETLWNSLPCDIRNTESLGVFKRKNNDIL